MTTVCMTVLTLNQGSTQIRETCVAPGAESVVTSEVPVGYTAIGNPARLTKCPQPALPHGNGDIELGPAPGFA